jgi:hypothetical protein
MIGVSTFHIILAWRKMEQICLGESQEVLGRRQKGKVNEGFTKMMTLRLKSSGTAGVGLCIATSFIALV